MSAYSNDGGQSWTIPPISQTPNIGQAKFSRCTGGNAQNGGDYERATDPWVSFSPNGVVHQISLGINDSNVDNAVIASRSEDGGANWKNPVVIKRDNQANFFNDKETLTANPNNSAFVYATWQRIVAPSLNASARAGERAAAFRSFAWFARSDDNGVSYDTVKPILDPGNKNQTIGNQIVVLPNGDLVMVFNLIRNTSDVKNRGFTAEVMRSTDNGDTWSNPIVVDRMFPAGVTDPEDGHGVRTGDLIPEIAVDNDTGSLYVVWQDSRFTGREQVALSKSEDGGLHLGRDEACQHGRRHKPGVHADGSRGRRRWRRGHGRDRCGHVLRLPQRLRSVAWPDHQHVDHSLDGWGRRRSRRRTKRRSALRTTCARRRMRSATSWATTRASTGQEAA